MILTHTQVGRSIRKKVVGEIQRSPGVSKPTSYANAQAVPTIEEEVETKVLQSVGQFPQLSEKVSLHACERNY